MALQKFLSKGTLNANEQLKIMPQFFYDELGVTSLKKNKRSNNELIYMVNYFKTFDFFKDYSEDIIKDCCRNMKYEVLQSNVNIYKRGELLKDDHKKLYLIINGQIGIYLNTNNQSQIDKKDQQIEIMLFEDKEHFGSQLFILQDADYFEIPGLVVKTKRQTVVATLAMQNFPPLLIQLEASRITQEVRKLYQFPIFTEISYTHLKKFYLNSFRFRYQYLEKVYNQNDNAEVVYLILEGQFEMTTKSQKGITHLGILSKGEVIGEHEILGKIQQRLHTIQCISEQGELLAFDSQFFKIYIYDLIKHNVEQVLETKVNYHSQLRKPINQKIQEIDRFCSRKCSLSIKDQKYHYNLKPKKDNLNKQLEEKDSYYDLYCNMVETATKSLKQQNGDRQRRISYFINTSLKPIQHKMKINSSLIMGNNESITTDKLKLNYDSLMQSICRRTFSKTIKSFSKTRSVLSEEKSIIKPKNQIPNFTLSIQAKQYKSVDKLLYKPYIQQNY